MEEGGGGKVMSLTLFSVPPPPSVDGWMWCGFGGLLHPFHTLPASPHPPPSFPSFPSQILRFFCLLNVDVRDTWD